MAKSKRKDQEPANLQVETPIWFAENVERRSVAALLSYPGNPRAHSPAQIAQLGRSIKHFGFTIPCLIDKSGQLIAGHGRVMAAKTIGLTEVPCIVRPEHWTEDDVRTYVVADNQLALNASWDPKLLHEQLFKLQQVGADLSLTGFDPGAVVGFIANINKGLPGVAIEDMDNITEVERGRLLELVKVTIDEPTHQVARGDHFVLDGKHHLLCVGVVAQWDAWVSLLKGEALFCPYPGVFVPFGTKAKEHSLIMIQPDGYICGHILDRWSEIHGNNTIAKVS